MITVSNQRREFHKTFPRRPAAAANTGLGFIKTYFIIASLAVEVPRQKATDSPLHPVNQCTLHKNTPRFASLFLHANPKNRCF
jgi:hypothetical protein